MVRFTFVAACESEKTRLEASSSRTKLKKKFRKRRSEIRQEICYRLSRIGKFVAAGFKPPHPTSSFQVRDARTGERLAKMELYDHVHPFVRVTTVYM